MEYSAADIIGKDLYAKRAVPIKRTAYDDAPSPYDVSAGSLVGTVYSYLEPTAGRSTLYWMFYDSAGVPYYVAHQKGLFDENRLRQQGVLTEKEKQELANQEGTPQWYKLGRNMLVTGLLIYGGLRYGPDIIKSLKK